MSLIEFNIMPSNHSFWYEVVKDYIIPIFASAVGSFIVVVWAMNQFKKEQKDARHRWLNDTYAKNEAEIIVEAYKNIQALLIRLKMIKELVSESLLLIVDNDYKEKMNRIMFDVGKFEAEKQNFYTSMDKLIIFQSIHNVDTYIQKKNFYKTLLMAISTTIFNAKTPEDLGSPTNNESNRFVFKHDFIGEDSLYVYAVRQYNYPDILNFEDSLSDLVNYLELLGQGLSSKILAYKNC